MPSRRLTLCAIGVAALVLGVGSSRAQTVQPPSAAAIIKQACDAAGGSRAFRSIPLLQVLIKGEEITTQGSTSTSLQGIIIAPPGPIPGRLEFPAAGVIAGDDGSGGWAVTRGKADSRPSTAFMVKRSIVTALFPILLPFSLHWDGVGVADVAAAELNGSPVWRLSLLFAKSFFASPQIATTWTLYIDRNTHAVLRAESPYTDLGKDLVADGMRFSWNNPTTVGAVTLPTEQRVVGLDELGRERPHSRIDHVSYMVLPPAKAQAIFTNPIPPEQRQKPNPIPSQHGQSGGR
jgi:hypothetical protein